MPVIFERSTLHHITATASGHVFEIYIQVPFGYDQSEVRYPVVYMLDGDVAFPMASGVLDMLTKLPNIEEIQYAVLVGITYTDKTRAGVFDLRSRDYTPTQDHEFNSTAGAMFGFGDRVIHSGKASEFLDFLRDDLLPFVDATYRTDPTARIIHGHSFGGLFLLYTLFNASSLFQKWLISSPSIWWQDKSILSLEETYAQSHDDLRANVYMSAGSHELSIVEGIAQLIPRLRERGYPGLQLEHEIMNGETHLSVWARAFTNGIRKMLPLE